MPQDKFADFASTLTTPATTVTEVIPNDTTDLQWVTLALNAATPGTVRVTTLDGSVSDISVIPGVILPLRVSRIWETGTTATGIRALC